MSICKLALEDGTVFTGEAFGATGTQVGEVVFNTALTGYQEVFTDPSYCGQIVTMTFPLIGNYGVNPDDFEAGAPHLSGFVVKELPRRPSNYRSTAALGAFLRDLGVIGIAGVDTRALTRRLRVHGALRGVLSTEILHDVKLVDLAATAPAMAGANLVERVAPHDVCAWQEPLWTFPQPGDAPVRHGHREPAHQAPAPGALRVVVLDCGIKRNILRHLVSCGGDVTVAPADADAGAVRELRPQALVVSNGPGDPAAVTKTIATLREFVGKVPVLGICLGHQMLGLALGAETYKLRFGHHGANVPVLNVPANRVEITSQNHGFAVGRKSLEQVGGVVTHVNLNDQSLEGFAHPDRQVLALQFHPEASPGPHDSEHVFRRFLAAVRAGKPIGPQTFAEDA
jgi:carbamoyl-phosphate synthase small subunit